MAVISSDLKSGPRGVRPADQEFVPLAGELGRGFAARAAQHDRDGSFVTENFEAMREAGYLRLAVPSELGGLGASQRQVCFAQAELARQCASTALAVNMHHYLVMANVYRFRNGATALEKVLRRIASEGIVLMTSGGSDWIFPSGTAVRDGDGFRVSGRKAFCSQAPVADLFTTTAVFEDPAEGRQILMMSIPMSAAGVQVLDTWDTMGMRATGSHDVVLSEVAVPEAAIAVRRPYGKFDTALRNALVHFSLPVAAVYHGIAEGARDEAVRLAAEKGRGSDPIVQRQVGLMDHLLKTSWWSLLGALDEMGDDYRPDDAATRLVSIAKRTMLKSAMEVVDISLEVAGGGSYYKRSPLEQAYRDVRAGAYHPLTPEASLTYAGRLALGESVDVI